MSDRVTNWTALVAESAQLQWLAIVLFTSLAVAIFLFFYQPHSRPRRQLILLAVALSMLGATAGMIGGLSRIGAAGQIVSAALSLIGGVAILLFTVRKPTENAGTAIATISFVVALFFGFVYGAKLRDHADRRAFWSSECIRIILEADLTERPFLDANFGALCGAVIGEHKSKLGLR